MSWRLVLTVEAEEDLDRILLWSHRYFGVLVREAYEALIIAGIEDVANSPMRVGSRARPELGASVMSWHLAQSRDRVAREVRRIDRPRHVIVYRVAGDEIHILRLSSMVVTAPLSTCRAYLSAPSQGGLARQRVQGGARIAH